MQCCVYLFAIDFLKSTAQTIIKIHAAAIQQTLNPGVRGNVKLVFQDIPLAIGLIKFITLNIIIISIN